MDLVILNHGQVTRASPELVPQQEALTPPHRVRRGSLTDAKTTQPTSRIRTLTSTFAGLKEDTCTKDSLAVLINAERALVFVMAWSADCFAEY
ncbi:hypothetical protein TNCV_3232651 [Trichonephila clavipes]|nr:hypothetical protein TNCV_3232651 [Trichonephila clavipes]